MTALNTSFTRSALPEVLTTNEVVCVINRRPQTLRRWVCLEDGPIRPIRINGRLAWRVRNQYRRC